MSSFFKEIQMRAFRVSFDNKTSKWVIEIARLNLAFFILWTPTRILMEDEKSKKKKYKVITFDKADEAYEYAKETGLDKLYEDVTSGMPWERGDVQPADRNVELANLLREVLAILRQSA
jgi:hypothetical protein